MTIRNLFLIMIVFSITLYYTVITLYHFIFNIFMLILTIKQQIDLIDIVIINTTLVLIMCSVFYQIIQTNKKSINAI